MKLINVFLFALVVVLFGCFNPSQEESTGTLIYRLATWNTYDFDTMNKPTVDTLTCPLIDIKTILLKIEVTQDTIIHEGPADQEWITLYESNEELLHSERDIRAVLDTGTYKGMRLTQRNMLYWVCTHPDNSQDTLEFYDLNNRDTLEVGEHGSLINYFGTDGFYHLVNDTLYNSNISEDGSGAGEFIGCYFKIFPGQITEVTMRMNLISLDWLDYNENGIYEYWGGDTLDNISTAHDSIVTMADFIVRYLGEE
ncbi:MAG: hypothetical protein WCT23_02365 [Candidatus Neomarinimicrobiota bacterium]|jgi:hypothetical protein